MKDLKIENSVYTTSGEINLEYLLYKIHNNFMACEITAEQGMEYLQEIIEQLDNK